MQPTEEQKYVLDKLLEFIESKSEDYISIIGAAGTGKSTVINLLIQHLPKHTRICFTSPTNKATKVLKSMSLKRGLDIECRTIHSLLGLQMKVDNHGKETLQLVGKPQMNKFDLVVCDEMSMVNEELFNFINQAVLFESDAQFIFMGDNNQLNPVNETESPTFKLENKLFLKSVIRQKHGNPILELCTAIRENIDNKKYVLPKLETKINDTGELGVHVMDIESAMNVISHLVVDESINKDPDSLRVIAWRNSTVDFFNSTIQQIKYPGLKDPFAMGENVTFSKPMHQISTNKDFIVGKGLYDGWDRVVCTTETEGIVESLTEIDPFVFEPTKLQIVNNQKFAKMTVRRCMVTVRLQDRSKQSFVIAADKRELQSVLDFIKTCAKVKLHGLDWRIYYLLQRYFTDIRPSYCITSHKSQASTFSNTVVHTKDIMLNPNKEEAIRSFYVACSRASQNLILLQ